MFSEHLTRIGAAGAPSPSLSSLSSPDKDEDGEDVGTEDNEDVLPVSDRIARLFVGGFGPAELSELLSSSSSSVPRFRLFDERPNPGRSDISMSPNPFTTDSRASLEDPDEELRAESADAERRGERRTGAPAADPAAGGAVVEDLAAEDATGGKGRGQRRVAGAPAAGLAVGGPAFALRKSD